MQNLITCITKQANFTRLIPFFNPLLGSLWTLVFGKRFSTCEHLVSTLYCKELSDPDDYDLLAQTLISEAACITCGFTLEHYLQLRGAVSTWPAPNWLCACGTIISSLSSSCPCKHPPRKDIFTDMALYCFRGIYQDQATIPHKTQEKNQPFSLTTALQILFHQDNLKYVNEWLAKVHPSNVPTLPPIRA